MAVLTLVKKDFINIFKSKLAIFILFIFPLLIVLGICISFNVFGFHHIKVVYYKNISSEKANNMFNSLIEVLKSKNYVLEEVDERKCIESVKKRQSHICMIVNNPIEESLNIDLYVDETRLNLAYALINQISQAIQVKSEEISITLIQAIIDVIGVSEKKTSESLQKLNELESVLNEIEGEKANIENNVRSIDTSFSIKDFDISRLESLVEDLENTNASNLTDDFKSAIEKIESKLEEIKRRFEDIEGKKTIILNSNNKIGILIATSKQLKQNTQENLNKISEATGNIKMRNVSVLTSPIKIDTKPISIPQKNVDYVLPEILAFIIMTLSLFFSSIIIIKERKSKAYFRNFLSPVKDYAFIFSSYLFLISIIMAEVILILLLISKFSTLIDKFFLLNFIPLLLISSTVFIFLGMLIGYLTKHEEVCILVIFIILLGFLFFSPMLMPSEMIKQQIIRKAVTFLPFNLIDSTLREIIFFKFSIVKEYFVLCLLLAYAAVFCLAAFLTKKLTKHQLLYT
jgi:ABC-type multidrug transport system permease subunit